MPISFTGDFSEELIGALDLNKAIRTEEATTQLQANSQKDTDLRNVKPGNASVNFSNGEFEVTTTASGASNQALESGLAEYQAGLPAAASVYVEKADNPVGLMESGYGGDAFNNGLFWRWASTGRPSFVRERAGVECEIPQSKWTEDVREEDIEDSNGDVVGKISGIDPMDGTGPSGFDVSPPVIGLIGVDMVLYGGGGFAPWFVDLREDRMEKRYAFVFVPKNESILTQFNQPLFGKLDNDGTATADSMIMTERQFITYGKPSPPTRATPHVVNEAVTISSPTAITAFRRRDAGGPVRLDVLDTFIRMDNRAHIWFLVNPTITNSPTWGQPVRDDAGNTVSQSETALEVSDDIAVDASTGIAIEGAQVPGGTGSNVRVQETSLASTPFQRDQHLVLMAEPFGGNDPSSQEAIVNIREGL